MDVRKNFTSLYHMDNNCKETDAGVHGLSSGIAVGPRCKRSIICHAAPIGKMDKRNSDIWIARDLEGRDLSALDIIKDLLPFFVGTGRMERGQVLLQTALRLICQ